MPKVPIIMPQLGESIAEATVVRLTAIVGDEIENDQEVIEVETNKAVMSVTTPCKGILSSFTAEVNETYDVGSVLGYIEASAEDAVRLNASESPVPAHLLTNSDHPEEEDSADSERHPSHSLEVPVGENATGFQSPRVRSRISLGTWCAGRSSSCC